MNNICEIKTETEDARRHERLVWEPQIHIGPAASLASMSRAPLPTTMKSVDMNRFRICVRSALCGGGKIAEARVRPP
jgi:hypothetical protein